MHQSVALAEEIHECAKVHDLDDRAFVNHTNFWFGHNRIDEIKSGLDGFAIAGGNFDEPVIANINLGAGGLNNFAHHFAARADNFADFILRHLNGLDFRGVFTHFIAGFGERFAHFTQNMRAAALRLVKRDLHNLFRNAGDFNVHLQRGNAHFRASNFEIHVAQMVFIAQNVGQHRKTVALFDEPHGNAGHRFF